MIKRLQVVFAAIVLCAFFATLAHAQMGGLDFFKKNAISSIFHPVVGAGAVYESLDSSSGAAKHDTEMVVVGKELVGTQEGYWLEIGLNEKQGPMYSKVLITKDDFQMRKIVFQMNGMPAMEMPFNPNSNESKRMHDEMTQWSQAGNETITVPAGTFSCVHWKKSDGKGDLWASDKISPFGMVKNVEPNSTMVLVKIITDGKDHITGPVQPFNPQALGQMMQNQPH